MRRIVLPTLVLLIGAVAWVWAESPEQDTQSPRRANASRRMVTTASVTADEQENLLALHKPTSSSYDENCLSCHGDVLTEQTEDPRTPSFHQAMMPFTPGYNPAHGPDNDVCVQCHRYVELSMDTASALRKQVDPAMCALCHGPSGPGPVFYAR